MNLNRHEWYLNLLKSEIAPALGCTEPAAVALCAAYAASALGEAVEELELWVSRYIFKNGMNVGIPGTGMLGLNIAAALGALSAKPERKLMVLNGLDEGSKQAAVAMVEERRVRVSLAETCEKIYIEAIARAGERTGRAVIAGTHTGLRYLERSGEVLVDEAASAAIAAGADPGEPYDVTLDEIARVVEELPVSELIFLRELIDLNMTIAQEGLTNDYGLKVGKSMLEGAGLISGDVANYAVAMTAAAADARMAGCDKPVMSAAGSGNQGLTATVPVTAIGRRLRLPEEKVLRALALSILVTVHTKHYIGRLSVLCGCSIAAAIGACCGVILLMDGNAENMKAGISSMVADISGVVCDGAKPGCALKIATAVSSAVRAANMALLGVGAGSHDGIVSRDVEKTLANLGRLGNEGMSVTNEVILGMMLEKS